MSAAKQTTLPLESGLLSVFANFITVFVVTLPAEVPWFAWLNYLNSLFCETSYGFKPMNQSLFSVKIAYFLLVAKPVIGKTCLLFL